LISNERNENVSNNLEYLGPIGTNQYFIQREIKGDLIRGILATIQNIFVFPSPLKNTSEQEYKRLKY
jgi:hypothetical protein